MALFRGTLGGRSKKQRLQTTLWRQRVRTSGSAVQCSPGAAVPLCGHEWMCNTSGAFLSKKKKKRGGRGLSLGRHKPVQIVHKHKLEIDDRKLADV